MEFLLDVCEEIGLVIGNTFFKREIFTSTHVEVEMVNKKH